MSKNNIIRAWKDPAYRNSLTASERASLPPNPAGAIEISDADLGRVTGGVDTLFRVNEIEVPQTLFCSWWTCSQLQCPTMPPGCLTK